MSDTKALIKYVRDRLNDGPNITFGKPTVRDMVDAIEQADAHAAKVEAMVARLQQRVNELLSEELTDGAVRERIQLRFNMHEVSQENARLTKMVDWLAELVFDRPCAYACCPFDKHRPTGPDDDECDKTHIQCWAEAARRAVADAESEVKG